MEYQKYRPPAALQNYIRYFWSFDSSQTASSSLHIKSFADQFPRLIFQDLRCFAPIRNLQGEELPICYISGIDTKPTDALMGSSFSHFGVSFFPHALNAFFKVDAQELINEMPAIQLFCKAEIQHRLEIAKSHLARVQLLSQYFYEKLYASKRKELFINHIIQSNSINYDSHIFDLPKKFPVSERQLERKFKTSVGISPKKFQRIIRFEKSLQLLQRADYKQLTAIAYQLNYTDQSHFIKDFKTFSGMTPYEFVKNQTLGSESSSFIYVGD